MLLSIISGGKFGDLREEIMVDETNLPKIFDQEVRNNKLISNREFSRFLIPMDLPILSGTPRRRG